MMVFDDNLSHFNTVQMCDR